MADVQTIGAADNPTGLLTKTKSGDVVDLLNMTGLKKMELIDSGNMRMDDFVSPPNMTGLKLKAIREEHRARMEKELARYKKQKAKSDVKFKVGEFISYKDQSYEVLKIEGEKLQIEVTVKGKLRKAWVAQSSVTKG